MKIILIGDARTGKSRAVKWLLAGREVSSNLGKYEPTIGCSVHPWTNVKGTQITFWDCGGLEKYRGLADAYYLNADICILFGKHVEDYTRDIVRVSPNVKLYQYSQFPSFKNFINNL